MERRVFLSAVASVFGAGCSVIDDEPEEEVVNAPEGGVLDASRLTAVGSVDGMVQALSASTEGDVVAVHPGSELDLSGQWEIEVPSGVTLAGGRSDDQPGALLKSPASDATPEYDTGMRKIELKPGARLTGFRLEGHYQEYVNAETEHDGDYYAHRGGGGVTVVQNGVVDNNEISGWPYAGVVARGNAYVHDNHIHHNTWEGLGYGVAIPEGDHVPIVESNYFNYNRHSITGSGGPRGGFVARFNLVGPDWVGSQFDMHGSDEPNPAAGREIIVHQNTFEATTAVEEKTRNPGGVYPAVDIRGQPTEGAWIEKNWFYHRDREGAVNQPNAYENVFFTNNHYGEDVPENPRVGAPASHP